MDWDTHHVQLYISAQFYLWHLLSLQALQRRDQYPEHHDLEIYKLINTYRSAFFHFLDILWCFNFN